MGVPVISGGGGTINASPGYDKHVACSCVWGGLRRRDGPEPLLPRGVPYLQLDPLAINVDRADFEVDADGGDVAACRRPDGTDGSVATFWVQGRT